MGQQFGRRRHPRLPALGQGPPVGRLRAVQPDLVLLVGRLVRVALADGGRQVLGRLRRRVLQPGGGQPAGGRLSDLLVVRQERQGERRGGPGRDLREHPDDLGGPPADVPVRVVEQRRQGRHVRRADGRHGVEGGVPDQGVGVGAEPEDGRGRRLGQPAEDPEGVRRVLADGRVAVLQSLAEGGQPLVLEGRLAFGPGPQEGDGRRLPDAPDHPRGGLPGPGGGLVAEQLDQGVEGGRVLVGQLRQLVGRVPLGVAPAGADGRDQLVPLGRGGPGRAGGVSPRSLRRRGRRRGRVRLLPAPGGEHDDEAGGGELAHGWVRGGCPGRHLIVPQVHHDRK